MIKIIFILYLTGVAVAAFCLRKHSGHFRNGVWLSDLPKYFIFSLCSWFVFGDFLRVRLMDFIDRRDRKLF